RASPPPPGTSKRPMSPTRSADRPPGHGPPSSRGGISPARDDLVGRDGDGDAERFLVDLAGGRLREADVGHEEGLGALEPSQALGGEGPQAVEIEGGALPSDHDGADPLAHRLL